MSLGSLSSEFLGYFERDQYDDAVGLLPKIKLELAKFGLLEPTSKFEQSDLLAARQILELGVLALIHAGASSDKITRLIAEVRPYYAPQLGLPVSSEETKIVALDLLLMLATNEITEFHSALESLKEDMDDKYIQYPIKLERWLMEGAYDLAWQAVTEKSQFPAPEFAILTQSLQSTIRNEIAFSSEKAYGSLPAANAKHLLFFNSDHEFVEFAQSRNWEIKNSTVFFPSAATADPEEDEGTEDVLIKNLLSYASQIETIV